MMQKNNDTIIVGAAQFTQRQDITQPLDPLSLMIKTCREALTDTGADGILEFIDSVYMVNINSWSYEDAPGELSKILGINPINKIYLPDGGDSPQMLVNRAAKAITLGECQVVLIVGGEAANSVYRAKKGKLTLNWPEYKEPEYMEGELWDGTTKFENHYGFKYPPYSYAIFETAVRAASGKSLEEHRHIIGKLFEHYSKVASNNPYAWTQEIFNADEIIAPTHENRYINHPYTKRMCSNMFVDQSAALIMTSEANAKKLKIEIKKWVYLMGGADLKNVHDITRRPHIYDSPAAKEGSKLALKQAGLTLEDINVFEIYSCFPSIVEIIMNEIGLSKDDPRDLSLTGGLSFFGGAWSNYSMHGIVSAVELIRDKPNLKVMVVANGGYNSKQSFGIYGTRRPIISFKDRDDIEIQKSILTEILPEPIEKASGRLTIEGYTITYERSGKPKWGVVIGMLENGHRTIASIMGETQYLLKLEQQELVGQIVNVHYDPKIGRNLAIFNPKKE